MKNLTEIFTFTDSSGNQIQYENGSLILSLSSGDCRNIGHLKESATGGLILWKDINSKKHILKVNRSIGFNFEVIQKLGENDSIWVRLNKKQVYVINAKKAREVGSFLWFKKQGFERQFFVELKDFSKID